MTNIFLEITYQVCMYEYEVRHAILHMKMAGWLLLEAVQPSLSNLLLLAVNYDIMLHFSWIVCPLFHAKKTNTLALSRMPSTEKESNTSVFLDHELDCCARGI